jgi:hypothetical protein
MKIRAYGVLLALLVSCSSRCYGGVISSGLHSARDALALLADRKPQTPDFYTNEAQLWVNAYAPLLSPQECVWVLGLLYSSWLRSEATCYVQKELYKALNAFEGAAHIFKTARLDPGTYQKSPSIAENTAVTLARALKLLSRHQEIALTYHHAVVALVHGPGLRSGNRAIHQLRKSARMAIARALGLELSSINALIARANSQLLKSAQTFAQRQLFKVKAPLLKRGIIKVAWNYAQQALAQTFFKTDREYTSGLNDCTEALSIAHGAHNLVWQRIEEIRAAYYHAHYSALYNYTIAHGTPAASLCLAFNQEGFAPHACFKKLPEPSSLASSFDLS